MMRVEQRAPAVDSKVPRALTEAIEAGTCVVFVGAGFSMPVMPSWAQLLKALAEHDAAAGVRADVHALLARSPLSALDFEAAAQLLREKLQDEAFFHALTRTLAGRSLTAQMRQRLEALKGIPFRAILTTNFDTLLSGLLPGRDAYEAVLRPKAHRWFDEAFWSGRHPKLQRPIVVKLHGDLHRPPAEAELVFTRRDYRSRLYGNPAFQTFLRAVLASNTVLFLGYSFSDAYLNELRSEVLALLGHQTGQRPVAYAVMHDVPAEQQRYFKGHEGIEILAYETSTAADGSKDHSGFDAWLKAIHEATNPKRRLGRLLEGKSILWLDANPDSLAYGWHYLLEATPNSKLLKHVRTVAEAEAELDSSRYDLVLTHWGHNLATFDGRGCSVAEALLRSNRRAGREVPVIVFASGDFERENKKVAFGLGAQAYAFGWPELFQQLERVL